MIPHDPKLKKQARTLRNKGKTYNQIAKELGIGKSTARFWCKDIVLSQEHRDRIYTKTLELLTKGPYSSHARRTRELEKINTEASKEIKFPLDDTAFKLFGAALYWAEGNKVSDFTITNSDPLLISFMTKWFCKTFQVKPENLKAHLNIYPQQNDLELKRFWSDITGIPLNKFGKSFVKPINKNYKKNTLYYGTIKVRVEKGTDYRHRVFGWINSVLKDSKVEVELVERKWYKLKDNKRT